MSHIEKKEFEIYRITPPPPKWEFQEYSVSIYRAETTNISIGFCTTMSRR